mmetsp:Transcript_10542/g.11593  ORF Transcript_10542/g.11593 Transcript_10542/m.11593 type:complete len:475 (+) Transcript_10542:46-1470(+)
MMLLFLRLFFITALVTASSMPAVETGLLGTSCKLPDPKHHSTIPAESLRPTVASDEIFSTGEPKVPEQLQPVLLVPGYSGAMLQGQLIDADLPAVCNVDDIDEKPFRLWVDLDFFNPLRSSAFVDCWFKMVALQYNKTTDTFSSQTGLEVLPVEYCGTGEGGGTRGLDYMLELFGYRFLSYYGNIISSMEANGFERTKNLRGAPFDWRKPVKHLRERTSFFVDLKKLIETMVAENGNKKIKLVAHSYGCLMSLNFLNTQTQEWKDKHIAAFIALSGPWAGTSKTVRDLLSGDDIIGDNWFENTFDIFDRAKIQQLAQGYGSLVNLLPDAHVWAKQPLVHFEKSNKTFTGSDLKELLRFAKLQEPSEILESVGDFYGDLKPPSVPFYCLNGINLPTERFFVYSTDDVNEGYPQAYCGNGDGSVMAESLRVCQWWRDNADNGGHPITYKEYPGVSHVEILNDKNVINDITNIMTLA